MATATTTARIIRIGNSAAVRLTKQVLKTAGLQVGQPVKISASEDCILIETTRKAMVYDLDQLLAGITAENQHREFSFGRPAGKEAL